MSIPVSILPSQISDRPSLTSPSVTCKAPLQLPFATATFHAGKFDTSNQMPRKVRHERFSISEIDQIEHNHWSRVLGLKLQGPLHLSDVLGKSTIILIIITIITIEAAVHG